MCMSEFLHESLHPNNWLHASFTHLSIFLQPYVWVLRLFEPPSPLASTHMGAPWWFHWMKLSPLRDLIHPSPCGMISNKVGGWLTHSMNPKNPHALIIVEGVIPHQTFTWKYLSHSSHNCRRCPSDQPHSIIGLPSQKEDLDAKDKMA